MATRALTFVTLVFESEVSLLALQAGSMSVHLAPASIHEIVVVDNSARGLSPPALRRVTQAYGDLAPSVRVVPARDVAHVPASIGWRRQQVVKLEVARLLSPGRYVVLDAKNHLIATPPDDFFVSADDRPCVNAYSYETHPLRPALEQSLLYFGIDPAEYRPRFTATVTPFVLDTNVVIDLLDGMAARGGTGFAEEFLRHDFTEFLLYSAWLLAQGIGLDEHYAIHQRFCPTVWPREAGLETVRAAIGQAEADNAPIFSVHRRALGVLDEAAVAELGRFWVSRGLFSDSEAAYAFVDRFRRELRRGERRRKLREMPLKARSALASRLARR